MADLDRHLAAAAAAGKKLEARVARLEGKLEHTRQEREKISRANARLKEEKRLLK